METNLQFTSEENLTDFPLYGNDYLALLENPPKDLYIPPEALEVFLEAFSGPLDLLLYLIKRQNIDILNIPIAQITRQYITYIELMKSLQLDLAAEYLVMAATLAQIKSKMLLPKSTLDQDEEDSRALLIKRLQEYERFKNAANKLDQLPRKDRDFFIATAEFSSVLKEKKLPDIDLQELMSALKSVLNRVEHKTHHQIQRETLSIRERMTGIISRLKKNEFSAFDTFFDPNEGKQGVVVTFMAILVLLKESIIEIAQSKPFAPIYIRRKGNKNT